MTSQKEGLNLQHGLRYTNISCVKISLEIALNLYDDDIHHNHQSEH